MKRLRADSNNSGGSARTNTGGTIVQRCMDVRIDIFEWKAHSFKGIEGVVGLKRWFKKMEQVFEICKCAEDDKTMGLDNANQSLEQRESMMTIEYAQATGNPRMEQELWSLTLFESEDDIEAYKQSFPRTGLDVS
ncbi:hypothetical protein Tco_0044939 [Tanacetum coccineum]